MKVFLIVLAVWALAIIVFLAGFWCGKRVTEMIYESHEKDDKEK